LADFVGLDTLKFICDGWYSQSQHLKGNDLVKTPKLLNEMVNQGKLGRKSGAGFYDYSQKK
jgi:3-hydroxyacyl-CoA dehydrogenase